jgi:hypothetical protein
VHQAAALSAGARRSPLACGGGERTHGLAKGRAGIGSAGTILAHSHGKAGKAPPCVLNARISYGDVFQRPRIAAASCRWQRGTELHAIEQ